MDLVFYEELVQIGVDRLISAVYRAVEVVDGLRGQFSFQAVYDDLVLYPSVYGLVDGSFDFVHAILVLILNEILNEFLNLSIKKFFYGELKSFLV